MLLTSVFSLHTYI